MGVAALLGQRLRTLDEHGDLRAAAGAGGRHVHRLQRQRAGHAVGLARLQGQEQARVWNSAPQIGSMMLKPLAADQQRSIRVNCSAESWLVSRRWKP